MDMVKVGPAGKQDGVLWEEKGEVAQIFVSHHDDKVVGLQFLFFENGKLVLSKRHGVVKFCENFNSVDMDYPSEFLTSISGSIQLTKSGTSSLSSISFNLAPIRVPMDHFGKASAADNNYHFNYQIGNRRFIGGFYGGKNCNGIESIGVYVNTITISMIHSSVKEEKEETDRRRLKEHMVSIGLGF